MVRASTALLFSIALTTLGCGDDDEGSSADASPSSADAATAGSDAATAADSGPSTDAPPAAFALTSAAYSEGGVIPEKHTCNGANVSPPLAWTNPPAGAKGYAIVFTDLSNGLVHSAIWDIPETRSSLPEDVDKSYEPADVPGAKQPPAYSPSVRGYLGPCPSSEHTYRFEIFAVDVATLPGLGQSSTRADVVSALPSHSLGSATLTGTYDPNG